MSLHKIKRLNSRHIFEVIIVFIISLLLGIWATEGSIALRNALLILGSILSVIYLIKWFKICSKRGVRFQFNNSNILCWFPSVMILAMFSWVIMHYHFFSQFPQAQWEELTSTWLRSFMACIIGFACAVILHRKVSFAWVLCVGLIGSFLVLIYQYIPKAIAAQSLFAIDWFGNYIYRAKFNGVLAGIILFTLILGLSLDSVRRLELNSIEWNNQGIDFKKIIFSIGILLGLCLPIYSFVFIFSAKNGTGVAAILLIFWFVVGSIYLLIQFLRKRQNNHSCHIRLRYMFSYLTIIIGAFIWFGNQHVKNNPGWESLIEDIKIGSQIDKYENWENPIRYGLPNRSDGSSVAGNTYERTALIVVGLRLISNNSKGNGILKSLPAQMREGGIDYNHHLYTHSAWIDLGLSYGWPGALLLPTALLFSLFICIGWYRGPFRATITSLALSFLILYMVGEYAFQHSIEILLFICALIAGLCGLQKKT